MIIVILVIILASAIGGGSDSSDNGATTPTETTTAVAAKADSNGNNIGDYTVKVKKATLCKDYLGNDAVKVVYSFTNNSKDAISFDVACTDEVYQDGIQLETTVPKSSFPSSANFLAPFTLSKIHLIFVAEK